MKRSRLVQMAVIRAREVCEMCRIWRIPSIDNIKALVNLEGLLGRKSSYLFTRMLILNSSLIIRGSRQEKQ